MTLAMAALMFTACATTPLAVRRPSALPHAQQLCDVAVTPGTDLYVELAGGDTARGRLDRLTCEVVELVPPETRRVVVRTEDIVLAGRVKGRSSTARGWLGAALGAAVVAPFGISMPGDMVLVGAAIGAIVGHNTGNSHVEVLFERNRPNVGRPARSIPLAAQ